MAESNSQEASVASPATPLLHPSSERRSLKANFLVQRLQKYTGFTKASNIFLFTLTAVIFAAYCIFRFPSLDIENGWGKGAAPGEWYWFRQGLYRTGITMHLWSVLPAGALMPLQFLPIMRRRYITFHKLNGRLLLILLMVGNISALMIADRAFGGTLATQFAVLDLAISTTVSTTKGYLAIRNLRIDQHRSWMLRTWAYASAILTMRILLVLVALSIKLSSRSYHTVSTCQELIFMYEGYSLPVEDIYTTYPACKNFTDSIPTYVVVNADITSGRPEEIGSILELSFGTCAWMGAVIHIFAVEWYLRSTADEDERLQKVSMARRKAAGLVDGAGKAGRQ